MKIILTGENITAQRAHQLGIVQSIFSTTEQLHEEQKNLALKIAQGSRSSLILAKEATKFAFENSYDATKKYERATFKSSVALEGGREGVEAFLNKRKANFDGI